MTVGQSRIVPGPRDRVHARRPAIAARAREGLRRALVEEGRRALTTAVTGPALFRPEAA
jgi:hypothetical protein